MTGTLYLRDAFGWHSEYTDKVAFAQLTDKNSSCITPGVCLQRQFEERSSYNRLGNSVKILGYVPVINVIIGILILTVSKFNNLDPNRPNNKQLWMVRGVAMIFTGPLLIVIDLIKFLYDCRIASKYRQEYPHNIRQFDHTHEHTYPLLPGLVECVYI